MSEDVKAQRELGKPLDSMVIAYEKRIEEQERRIASYQRLYKDRGVRIANLEVALRDYLEALNRKYLAVRDDRSQAEEDATLALEMYEKRLRRLIYGGTVV